MLSLKHFRHGLVRELPVVFICNMRFSSMVNHNKHLPLCIAPCFRSCLRFILAPVCGMAWTFSRLKVKYGSMITEPIINGRALMKHKRLVLQKISEDKSSSSIKSGYAAALKSNKVDLSYNVPFRHSRNLS